MKTPDEIVTYLAERIGHIYFHPKPKMFAADAQELDVVLRLYHEIWAEIVGRQRELGRVSENALGIAIPYRQQHPDATEDETMAVVVREWIRASKNLNVPIPYDALAEKFRGWDRRDKLGSSPSQSNGAF